MIEPIVREIFALSRPQSTHPSYRGAAEILRATTGENYSTLVGRLFDRRQVRQIFIELSNALPALNKKVLRAREPRRFVDIAASAGAQCVAGPFEATQQSRLRGFYLRQAEGIKRPLIWVNTATPQVVTAVSFWHELGHHLTARLFDDCRHELHLSFGINYHLHLRDPLETAADMLSVLAAYPKPAAERLFSRSLKSGVAPDADSLLARLRLYLRSVSGFDFERGARRIDNLRHAAAMIHFGKLRWALLSEFDI